MVSTELWPDVVDRFDDYSACYEAMSENVAAHSAESARYYRWMADVIRPHLGRRTLELGAGPGLITPYLRGLDLYIATETWPPFVNTLQTVAESRAEVRVEAFDVANLAHHAKRFRDEELDSIFSTNLLEHVKDDVSVLSQMKAVVLPHGRVVNLVPAFRELYGPIDRAIGHYRRYERKELIAKYAAAGLRVEKLEYFNLAGYLSWAWLARVSKSRNTTRQQFRSFNAVVPLFELFEYGHPACYRIQPDLHRRPGGNMSSYSSLQDGLLGTAVFNRALLEYLRCPACAGDTLNETNSEIT